MPTPYVLSHWNCNFKWQAVFSTWIYIAFSFVVHIVLLNIAHYKSHDYDYEKRLIQRKPPVILPGQGENMSENFNTFC